MNKFPLDIDGKEYVFTVNRRTNTLAIHPNEKLANLLDHGMSPDDIEELMKMKDQKEMYAKLRELNIPITSLLEAQTTNVSVYEDMFYNCLVVEHPMSKEEAMKLMNKAEEEYGWDTLSEALEVMSAEGFTMNADAPKKEIAWMKKTQTAKRGRPAKNH